jgi:two-component system, OmpR family, phosphate regulon sensor histidine kinase PhoR
MKNKRTNLFIAISSIALVLLLCIQVNWMMQSAKIKKDIFNEKANMVLSKTIEAIGKNDAMCREIETSLGSVQASGGAAILKRKEMQAIDSLLNYYMRFYTIDMGYSFVVVKPKLAMGSNLASNMYGKRLAEISSESEVQLKLIIPDKRQFLLAEMGPLFIVSVVLILVIFILFWQTSLSLLKEKTIAEHTSEFLNNMTHEFKTPLTNINLAGKMMLRDIHLKQPEKVKHYSDIILEENEKLRLQVERVLSMSALEKGEIRLELSKIDLHQLITNTVKCMNLQIESKHGTIEVKCDAANAMVLGDYTHLTNTLYNLIDNSIKYTPHHPELRIQTSNRDQNIRIRIADNGMGIEKVYQDKIFDKFFRVPTGDVHDVKGFGLGLAYVKKIIELHKGNVYVQSEPQQGTLFTIELPYA